MEKEWNKLIYFQPPPPFVYLRLIHEDETKFETLRYLITVLGQLLGNV